MKPEVQHHLANRTFIQPGSTDLKTQELQNSEADRNLETPYVQERNVHSQQKPQTSYGGFPRKSNSSKNQW